MMKQTNGVVKVMVLLDSRMCKKFKFFDKQKDARIFITPSRQQLRRIPGREYKRLSIYQIYNYIINLTTNQIFNQIYERN